MSIDLVYPGSKDTVEAVKGLSDDWIIVGPIRATVHLAGVWHTLQPKVFKYETATTCSLRGKSTFSPVDLNHPWVRWAMESDANYSWLYFYAQDMVEEYERRFGFKPYIVTMLSAFEDMPSNLPEGEWSEPIFSKDIEFT